MKNIKLIFKLFPLLKGNIGHYIHATLLIIVSSLTTVLIPFFITQILDTAIGMRSIEQLTFYIIMLLFTTIIGASCMIIHQYLVTYLSRELVITLRRKCINHIQKLSGKNLVNINSGDLYTILHTDIEEIPEVLTSHVFRILSNIITFFGILFILLRLQIDLVIILAIFQIITYLIQSKVKKTIMVKTEVTRDCVGKLNSSSQEMISNLLSFSEGGMKDYFNKKHRQVENEYKDSYTRLSMTFNINDILLMLLNGIIIATTLGFGGYKVIIGTLSYGGLITFNIYAQRFMRPVLQLVNINNMLHTSSIYWNRISEFLNTEIEVQDGLLTSDVVGDIDIDDVSFQYEKDKALLNNLSMKFTKGKIHAIVGASGAGKTTISHLLFRLWDVNKGRITIDGIDIREYSLDFLRSKISIVTQNIFLLNDTLYNNIVLGDTTTDNEKLECVLRQAGIYDYVNSLPNKLDTIVGENGIKLSGGERQRISIARALMRNSPILIFDEATSMLDNDTEDKIISAILDKFQDKTIILIAHRLSTVKKADIIYVLNNGTITESGTHDQLLNKQGIYFKLYSKI